MEINLRNVPFSEELLFFIRRCAGPGARDLAVRVRRTDVPSRVHEVEIARTGTDDRPIVETDPDLYLAVRNAFAVLHGRDDEREVLRPAANDDGLELHG